MWPLDLPARDVLRLPGGKGIPWAVFDPAWYVATYGSAEGDNDPASVLGFYLEVGQRLGHSPNRMFDEQWHRLAYPAIAAGVAAGDFASAFDAYCRRGCRDRSAHWLFDELAYRDRYQDLTDDILNGAEIANGYDHYLRHGVEEDRVGHALFDPATFLSQFDHRDQAAIRAYGVFQHYLARIERGGPDLRTSIYFDPEWYLQRYPDVARAIAAGEWKCALHHYLCNDDPTAFDPNAHFSESFYLQRDPGLLRVIESRHFRNGYAHFLRFGAKELRPPTAAIDLKWYAEQNRVRTDLEQEKAQDAFAHWLAIGSAARLPAAKPPSERVSDTQARAMLQQAALAHLPLAGRFGYWFTCPDEPMLSVVMVVRDGFAMTMATIASLRANTHEGIELIIIDRGSRDETRSIGQYVPGAKVLRFESDIGWSRAAEAGRQLATRPFVLFLSSEAQLALGSVERACIRLAADPAAGAVGGMIVQPTGVIGQAGGILWNDGGTHDYQRGESPLAPEANFIRAVDHCSPAFLMARAEVLTQIGGFDHDCGEGYEGIDLCLRVAEAGFRVLYDPSIVVVHDDLADRPDGANAHFLQKHATALAGRHEPGGAVQAFARHAGTRKRRILFIDDTIPLRRTGSGFVRSNDLIKVMAELGYAVTVYPVNGCDQDLARVFGDMPETAEVMHTHALARLKAFLEGRDGYYDIVWVARAHNLARTRPILAPLLADARVILDTEALAPYREAIQASLAGTEYDLDAAMAAFLADTDICRSVVAVTDAEATILRDHALPDVHAIGHMVERRPTSRGFAQRAGILFVGAIHTPDSPNLDSLTWFVDSVLPLIEAALGWQTRLTIAGYLAPGIDLARFENHPRITLRGPVADLEPLYNAHRVFVAPTRFAAGAPYKVIEAASFGVPIVATDLLVRQLDWASGEQVMAATPDDPAAFAAAVLALYRNEDLWRTVRDGALLRLRQESDPANFARAVSAILGSPPHP